MLARISQRDLRLRSKEIMDAVEDGHSFVVTRDGREMGQLVPLRRRFITREQFALSSRHALQPDPDRWRTDLEDSLDLGWSDPYDR